MDTVRDYGHIVQHVLDVYTRIPSAVGELETILIKDEPAGHYALMVSGWQRGQRMHYCLAHVEIREGKVYVHHDGTDDRIVGELEEAGIPRDALVLVYYQQAQHTYSRATLP